MGFIEKYAPVVGYTFYLLMFGFILELREHTKEMTFLCHPIITCVHYICLYLTLFVDWCGRYHNQRTYSTNGTLWSRGSTYGTW